MKHHWIPGVLLLTLAVPAVHADDRHHPEKDKASGAASAPSGMNAGAGVMDVDGMQQRMKEMQRTMQRIHDTEDPEERQRLLQEHMERMHRMMSDMRGAMEREATGSGGSDKTMQERQQMMERRMDMMQGMMEQMMAHMMARHRSATPAPPAPRAGDGGKNGTTDRGHDHQDRK